ncbi:hypothetical protein KKI23_01950, partial [Patescibacteria group bacterium]|nr:hypothetical protein [Patescibacteria group bacterium]
MERKNKPLSLLSFLFGLVVFLWLTNPNPVNAYSIEELIYLDGETIAKGYTVSDQNQDFKLGIFPDVFQSPSWVKIVKQNNFEYEIPDDKNLVSSIFTYDISMDDPHVLDQPIVVALSFQTSLHSDKNIYFYNRESASWQQIPTVIFEDDNLTRAFIHFPYTTLAVLEDKQYQEIGQLDSQSALLVSLEDNQVLFSKESDQVRPIASLTKLMTAIVFLDQNIDFASEYTIPDQFSYQNTVGAKLYVRAGEIVTVGNLFYTMLVGSANNAALALA